MNEIERISEQPSLLAVIERAARDPSVDVAKMQALLDMQERITVRMAEAEFNEAFARLSAKLPRVRKGGNLEYPIDKNRPDGPKRKIASFARWEDIAAEITPLLIEEGFSLSYTTQQRAGDGGGLIVVGTLLHRAGHSRSASIPVALDTSGGKNNIQAAGSSFSYGKRYTTTMLLNLTFEGEDDDGATAADVLITSAQEDEIMRLISETRADQPKLLTFFGVNSLSELPDRDYARAVNLLMAKKRKEP